MTSDKPNSTNQIATKLNLSRLSIREINKELRCLNPDSQRAQDLKARILRLIGNA